MKRFNSIASNAPLALFSIYWTLWLLFGSKIGSGVYFTLGYLFMGALVFNYAWSNHKRITFIYKKWLMQH